MYRDSRVPYQRAESDDETDLEAGSKRSDNQDRRNGTDAPQPGSAKTDDPDRAEVAAPLTLTPSPHKCWSFFAEACTAVISAAASVKGLLATTAWLRTYVSTPEAPAIAIGTILAPAAIPFYMENVIVGILVARARVDKEYARDLREYQFYPDKIANQNQKIKTLALANCLTLNDLKDLHHMMHPDVPTLSPKKSEALTESVARENSTAWGMAISVLGGAGGAISQYGMVLHDKSDLVKVHPAAFSIIVGIANFFVMYPNTLRSRKALSKMMQSLKKCDCCTFMAEFVNLIVSTIASASYLLGGQKVALGWFSFLDPLCPKKITDIVSPSLPISWIIGVLFSLPQIGIYMNSNDEYIHSLHDPQTHKLKAKLIGTHLKDNFWGIFLCAVTNALPSGWYTFTGLTATPLAPLAIVCTILAGLSIVITKGPAFQRFIQACWEKDCIRSCLSCGDNAAMISCIEACCCFKKTNRPKPAFSANERAEVLCGLLNCLKDDPKAIRAAGEGLAATLQHHAEKEPLLGAAAAGYGTGAGFGMAKEEGAAGRPHRDSDTSSESDTSAGTRGTAGRGEA